MKKLNSILILAATVAAVSCAKSQQPVSQMTLTASLENTKTYLADHKNVVWAEGETINVLTASDNKQYTLTEGKQSTSGKFTGDAVSGDIYALYPYDANATISSGVISTRLVTSQNLKPEGFGTNTNLMVAKADKDGALDFKNVCGLIKIQVKGDNIGKIIITGNNDEYLAGTVKVSFNGDGEPVWEIVEGSKSITLQMFNGSVITPGTYYAVVLPQTFSKGITITCKPYTFTTNTVIKKVYKPTDLVKVGTSALELNRSTVVPVGYIDQGPVWDYSAQTVFVGAIRGADTDHGHYLDMSTGRTIYPVGANAYAVNCDLAMITNGSNGIAPNSMTAIGGFTNATNIGYLGTYDEADNVANWTADVKSNNWFCYVTSDELSDTKFAEIKTVAEIKAIYDAHSSSLVQKYFTNNTTNDCVTNANRTTDHKFLVIKTYTGVEGTGYGIIKFNGLSAAGSPKKWYINTSYKWGLEAPAK